MRIQDHRVTKMVNGLMRRLGLQELTSHEAEAVVLYFMERHAVLNAEYVLPVKDAFRFKPATYLRQVMKVTEILMAEMLDLLFTMRGIESIYCLKGRIYHENGEGNQS